MSQPCQQQNSEESDHFRRQERQPDTVQPPNRRASVTAQGMIATAPRSREPAMAGFGCATAEKIGNQQDIDASKEKAQEIQPEPAVGVMQKFGVLLLVEDLDQWIGHAPGQHQNERFHDQGRR